jgi:hypothetical protein
VNQAKNVEESAMDQNVTILWNQIVKDSVLQIQFVKEKDANLHLNVKKLIVQKLVLIILNVIMLLNIHVMNVEENFHVKDPIATIHQSQVLFVEITLVMFVKDLNAIIYSDHHS